MAKAALEAAVEFAGQRSVGAKHVTDFQGIRWTIAELVTKLEAAELLRNKAATLEEKREESQLKSYPNGSLLYACAGLGDNEAIVRAVLVLAQHMNLTIVAEGVEDQETLDKLSELGCDIAQGFYFAKPMPLEEYIKWRQDH